MQLVEGALKRLDMIRTMPELRENLENVNALQGDFVKEVLIWELLRAVSHLFTQGDYSGSDGFGEGFT